MRRSSTHSSEPGPAPRRFVVAVAVVLSIVGGIAAALAIAEAVLRIRHFEYQPYPVVQFGWPEPQVIVTGFQPDPDLLWVTKDYRMRLREARRTHVAVIFLGDSCVEYSSYPRQVLERAGAVDPALATGEKLSVPGWSSEQGRAQLARDVLPSMHPRVITIEFGWNDHWDALGPSDDETHPSSIAQWLRAHVRIYQAYIKAREGIQARRQLELPRRVGLDRYRDNLRTMVADASRQGIHVVLVTAPTDQEVGHEPEYLRARHLKQLSQLVPLHRSYVEATRGIARATGATLCDAAAAVDALGPSRRTLFRQDGIHFTDAGDRFMGEYVARCVLAADGR